MHSCSAAVLLLAFFTSTTLLAQEVATHPVATAPAAIKAGSGFDYSRGDYGFTQDTEVLSVPLNLAHEAERWAFRASLPYLSIKGPASVIAGQTPVAAPGRPVTRYESGVGDALLSATYHAHPVPGEWNLDLTARVKLPTADEAKGLGTGETDYYAQADFYKSFGTVTPFASVGYRVMGTSALYPLEDGFYASAGASFLVAPGTVIGAAYDWRSRIIDGAEHATDALLFVSTNPNDRWNLLGYVLTGFNDAAPDLGVGGAVTYKF